MSMPMASISRRVISRALSLSNRRNGPHPFVGSEPRKKLRHTAISGTIARSW
jgi:hypothetical protein